MRIFVLFFSTLLTLSNGYCQIQLIKNTDDRFAALLFDGNDYVYVMDDNSSYTTIYQVNKYHGELKKKKINGGMFFGDSLSTPFFYDIEYDRGYFYGDTIQRVENGVFWYRGLSDTYFGQSGISGFEFLINDSLIFCNISKDQIFRVKRNDLNNQTLAWEYIGGSVIDMHVYKNRLFVSNSNGLMQSHENGDSIEFLYDNEGQLISRGQFFEFDNKLFLTGSTPKYGRELYVTNGLQDGTHIVSDIQPGTAGGFIDSAFNFDEKVFLSIETNTYGRELWALSKGGNSITLLKDINPGTAPSLQSFNEQYILYKDKIYFTAKSDSGEELWRTGGTPESTELFADIISGSEGSYPFEITVYNNELYFVAQDWDDHSKNAIYKSEGTKGDLEKLVNVEGYYHDLIVNDGRLFFISNDSLFSIEGTSESFLKHEEFNGVIDNANYLYSFNDVLYVVSNNGLWKFTDNLSKINVFAYWDNNENGMYDSNESGVESFEAQIFPSQFKSYTNSLGKMTIYIDDSEDSVLLKMYSPENWYPTGKDSLKISTSADSLIYSFGFQVEDLGKFIKTDIVGSPARCNSNSRYFINIKNIGGATGNIDAKFIVDSRTEYYNATPEPSNRIGDTLIWHLGTIFPYSSKAIQLDLMMPDEESTGNKINHLLSANFQSDSYYKKDSIIQTIRCAFDPNDKSIFANLDLDTNLVKNDIDLKYTIRFQNIGNDIAYQVKIIDQLDSNLDYNSFQILQTSHEAATTLSKNGLLKFVFDDIHLPDSASNQEGSNGFVSYSIRPIQGLPETTEILNKADIYFDYNQPIETNEVKIEIKNYLNDSIFSIKYDSTLVSFEDTIRNELFVQSLNFENDTITSVTVDSSSYRFSTSSQYIEIDTVESFLIDLIEVSLIDSVKINLIDSTVYYVTDTIYQAITGLNEFSLSENGNILVYPNPSEDLINIECENLLDVRELRILSSHGELLGKIETNMKKSERYELDISNYKPGVYFIILFTKEETFKTKFIVNRD